MYDGFIQLGNDELANIARFKAYIEGSDFPWTKVISDAESEALRTAIGDEPYTTPAADNAPWYDPGNAASANFYGLYITDIQGDEDSTRGAEFTQSVGDGGSAAATRYGSRQMRVKAVLAARDELAMEAGLQWLNRVIDPDDCPGGDCGSMTLCGYAAAPGYLETCDTYDYPTPSVRRNLIVDPAFQTASAWTSGVTLIPGSALVNIRTTAIVPAGTALVRQTNSPEARDGNPLMSGSWKVTNRGAADVTVAATHFVLDGAYAEISRTVGASVTISPGATATVRLDGSSWNSAYLNMFALLAVNAMPAGSQLTVGDILWEQAAVAGTPFSGATTGLPDTQGVAWVGAANNSESLLYTAGVDASRHLNEVTAIDGVSIDTRRTWTGGTLREVEFGLEAGTPWFFSTARNAIDSGTVAAGKSIYYDEGALLSVNHIFDPRGRLATRWSTAGSTAANTATYLFNGPITAGKPPLDQNVNRLMSFAATGAGAAIEVTPATKGSGSMKTIIAGNRYVASGYASANFVGSIQVRINWYNASGVDLGSSVSSATVNLAGNVNPVFANYARYSVAGTAPGGAVYGVPTFRFMGTSGAAVASGNTFYLGWTQFERVRSQVNVPADSPTDWFDADVRSFVPITEGLVAYNVTDFYEWEGAQWGSASWRFASWMCDYVNNNGSWTQKGVTGLQDPLTGTLPAPPSVPSINPVIPEVGLSGWDRSFFAIPGVLTPENGVAVPTIALTLSSGANPTATRQVRIRFYANEGGGAPTDIDPCSYCAELIFSYVAIGTTFHFDGETHNITADTYAGVGQPANGYVYGTGGGPIIWPELTCGVPYVMTLDQPNATSTDILVTVDLTQRM